MFLGFSGDSAGKESACRPGFDLWVGKIPWRRAWHCTPVFLPGESHGQRSLVGSSPWGHKGSDTTERLSTQPSSSEWDACFNLVISSWALTKLQSRSQQGCVTGWGLNRGGSAFGSFRLRPGLRPVAEGGEALALCCPFPARAGPRDPCGAAPWPRLSHHETCQGVCHLGEGAWSFYVMKSGLPSITRIH